MRLLAWMRQNDVSDDALALLVGGVTGHAVRKWKYGERVPSSKIILKIETITAGLVALRDWVPSTEGAAR